MLCRLRSFSYDSKQNCEVQIHFVEQNSRDLRVFWKKILVCLGHSDALSYWILLELSSDVTGERCN